MKKYKSGAAELKDLIQQVLHHPDFDPQDVDHDMHDRLMRCIEDEDIQVIDLPWYIPCDLFSDVAGTGLCLPASLQRQASGGLNVQFYIPCDIPCYIL